MAIQSNFREINAYKVATKITTTKEMDENVLRQESNLFLHHRHHNRFLLAHRIRNII